MIQAVGLQPNLLLKGRYVRRVEGGGVGIKDDESVALNLRMHELRGVVHMGSLGGRKTSQHSPSPKQHKRPQSRLANAGSEPIVI